MFNYENIYLGTITLILITYFGYCFYSYFNL